MMLLIFICPALQNPLSARGGATKAYERRRARWPPRPRLRAKEKGKGPRKAGGGRAPLAAQGNAACRGRAPRWRVLGCGLGETRLSQSCALRGPPLGIPAAARFFSRERLAHPGHIDFLITADRFIGSKQIAYFGDVSIVGSMVGALPREGAQGRGLWERRECKGPAPPEPRVCAHRTARHGSPCHEFCCTLISRDAGASPGVQLPLAAGRAEPARRPSFTPCRVQASSPRFLIPL